MKLLVTAAALLWSGAASATDYIGSVSFTDTTNNNRLKISGDTEAFSATNLTAGMSKLLPGVITLTTSMDSDGCAVLLGGCTNSDNIFLTFNFTSPDLASVVQGGTGTEQVFQLFGFLDNGNIVWKDSFNVDGNGNYAKNIINFANGAVAELDVYNSALAGSSSSRAAQIDIRIKDIKDAVPEPATWAMMLVGFGAVGASMRRRQKVTARTALA